MLSGVPELSGDCRGPFGRRAADPSGPAPSEPPEASHVPPAQTAGAEEGSDPERSARVAPAETEAGVDRVEGSRPVSAGGGNRPAPRKIPDLRVAWEVAATVGREGIPQ